MLFEWHMLSTILWEMLGCAHIALWMYLQTYNIVAFIVYNIVAFFL